MTGDAARLLIGSDTGGTFTDFVRLDETGLRSWKIPSTPDDFARAVLDGVGRLLAGSPTRPAAVELVHSTTVATNALLERKGARVTLLLLHSISLPPGAYGGDAVERLFTNRLDARAHPYFRDISHMRVSAHFYVRRDGALQQFVPVHRRAWHAGASRWRDRLTGCTLCTR